MKRYLKILFILALCALMLTSAVGGYQAATVIHSNGYELLVEDDNTTALNGWDTGGVLTVPNSVDSYYISSIADYAFMDDTSLTGLDLSRAYTLRKIGYLAFKGCANIAGTITIPSRVTTIGAAAFQECASVTAANLYSGSRTIPNQLFYGCGSLSEVTINYGFQSIGKLAFANCQGLQTVNVSWTVTEIDRTAFYNSPNVTLNVWFGSYAHQFAKDNSIPFRLLDGFVLGDADSSGTVNINDVTALQRALAELDPLNDLQRLAADVNNDGVVDIGDATTLQMYLAEYETPYSIGETITQ